MKRGLWSHVRNGMVFSFFFAFHQVEDKGISRIERRDDVDHIPSLAVRKEDVQERVSGDAGTRITRDSYASFLSLSRARRETEDAWMFRLSTRERLTRTITMLRTTDPTWLASPFLFPLSRCTIFVSFEEETFTFFRRREKVCIQGQATLRASSHRRKGSRFLNRHRSKTSISRRNPSEPSFFNLFFDERTTKKEIRCTR